MVAIYLRICIFWYFVPPGQTCLGSAYWAVFAADPVLVIQGFQLLEQEGVVNFTCTGFVATGIVGDLDVTNTAQVLFECASQVTCDDLSVVEIQLHGDVGAVNLGQ